MLAFNKSCKICSLYVNQGGSFLISNNMRWELRSHVIWRDINVIYYLNCDMCDHKETCIRKTVSDNFVVVKAESINSLVNVEWNLQISTCKFPMHVYQGAMKNKCFKEPYF